MYTYFWVCLLYFYCFVPEQSWNSLRTWQKLTHRHCNNTHNSNSSSGSNCSIASIDGMTMSIRQWLLLSLEKFRTTTSRRLLAQAGRSQCLSGQPHTHTSYEQLQQRSCMTCHSVFCAITKVFAAVTNIKNTHIFIASLAGYKRSKHTTNVCTNTPVQQNAYNFRILCQQFFPVFLTLF